MPTNAQTHAEADFVAALNPTTVLDAGCGSGRVAIELARRGIGVVGIDVDPRMLRVARRNGPDLTWHLADISVANLHRRFDLVLLAGNVLIFLQPGSPAAALKNMARHLVPGGLLVAGFQLAPGYLDLAEYDRLAEAANLDLSARYVSWDRQPWTANATYSISVHRKVSHRARKA